MYDPGSTISSGHIAMPPEIFKHSDYNARAMKRAEGKKRHYGIRAAVAQTKVLPEEANHIQAMRIKIAYRKQEKLPRIVQTQTNTHTKLSNQQMIPEKPNPVDNKRFSPPIRSREKTHSSQTMRVNHDFDSDKDVMLSPNNTTLRNVTVNLTKNSKAWLNGP